MARTPAKGRGRPLPAGTVTFLMSDIEGSTRLFHRFGSDYLPLLAEHRRLLRDAVARHDGHEVETEGDALLLAFAEAVDAVAAALDGQRALAAHRWPEGGDVRVRIGLHTGPATPVGAGYVASPCTRPPGSAPDPARPSGRSWPWTPHRAPGHRCRGRTTRARVTPSAEVSVSEPLCRCATTASEVASPSPVPWPMGLVV